MIGGTRGLNELLGPRYRLVIMPPKAKPCRPCRDGGGDVEVTVVGGPPKRGPQVGQLNAEPVVGLPLVGTVPPRQDAGFASGKVPRVGGPDLGRLAAGDELFLGELADR